MGLSRADSMLAYVRFYFCQRLATQAAASSPAELPVSPCDISKHQHLFSPFMPPPGLPLNPGLRHTISDNTGVDVSGHWLRVGGGGVLQQRNCAIDPIISPQRGVVT